MGKKMLCEWFEGVIPVFKQSGDAVGFGERIAATLESYYDELLVN